LSFGPVLNPGPAPRRWAILGRVTIAPARPETESGARRQRRALATQLRVAGTVCDSAAALLMAGSPNTGTAAIRRAESELLRVVELLRRVRGAKHASATSAGRSWLLTLEPGKDVCAGQGMVSGLSWMVRGAQREIEQLQRDHPNWDFRVTWVSSTIGGNSVRTLHATNGLAVLTGSSAASLDTQIKQAERGT
jgi:hypothetical protein